MASPISWRLCLLSFPASWAHVRLCEGCDRRASTTSRIRFSWLRFWQSAHHNMLSRLLQHLPPSPAWRSYLGSSLSLSRRRLHGSHSHIEPLRRCGRPAGSVHWNALSSPSSAPIPELLVLQGRLGTRDWISRAVEVNMSDPRLQRWSLSRSSPPQRSPSTPHSWLRPLHHGQPLSSHTTTVL